MSWPTATEYSEAIQNLGATMRDPELRAGMAATNALGTPLVYSGGLGCVFKVVCANRVYAVKCFTREVSNLHERYRKISEHLAKNRLPFMVDFKFHDDEILVHGRRLPVLKMQWVDGLGLDEFIRQNLDQPGMLRQLLGMWPKLASRLRAARITHADLQHGNVMMVPMDKNLLLKLIDYDGMHIPALSHGQSGEYGHDAYQHPSRLKQRIYSADVDRFSHLVIYNTIQGVLEGGSDLWKRYHSPKDNLIFKPSDFANPGESALFGELWSLGAPSVRAITGRLIIATQSRLEEIPQIDELVHNDQIRPLTSSQERQALEILNGALKLPRKSPLAARVAEIRPGSRTSSSPAVATATVPVLQPAETTATPLTTVADAPAQPHEEPVLAEVVGPPPDLRSMLMLPGKLVLGGILLADRLLVKAVGEENRILHPFVRTLVVGLLILGMVALIYNRGNEGEEAVVASVPAKEAIVASVPAKEAIVGSVPIDEKTIDPGMSDEQLYREARADWAAAWSGANQELMKEHAEFGLETAKMQAVSAEALGKQEKYQEAVQLYREAIDTLTQNALYTQNTVITSLESELNQQHRPAAAVLLAKLEVLIPEDPRLASWREVLQTLPLPVFKGHLSAITSVAFSPDGKQVLTGSQDNQAKLWDANTQANLQSYSGHSGYVTSVAFSPDGNQVITGSWDSTARLWTAATGIQRHAFLGHVAIVNSVAFSPDGTRVLTGSADQSARLWTADTAVELHSFTGPGSVVTAVAFSPDGKQVLTGSDDNTARLWDAATEQQVLSFSGHTQDITAVAFSPDGKHVLTGSEDNTARLWDAATEKEVLTYSGHTQNVTAVAFSPDGKHILTGSQDDTARLWDADTGEELHKFSGHTGDVTSVAFSPDGKLVLTGSDDRTARLWDVPVDKPAATTAIESPTKTVRSSTPPIGLVRDVWTKAWNSADQKLLKQYAETQSNAASAAAARAEKSFQEGDDASARSAYFEAFNHLMSAHALALTNLSREFQEAANSGNTSSPQELNAAITRLIQGWPRQGITPDGRMVIINPPPPPGFGVPGVGPFPPGYRGPPGGITPPGTGFGPSGNVPPGFEEVVIPERTIVRRSPTGEQIVERIPEQRILRPIDRPVDVEPVDEKPLPEFALHLFKMPNNAQVYSFAISPDGERMVTGLSDNSVALWDLSAKMQIGTFESHRGNVQAVAFISDGRRILSGSSDNTAILWDVNGTKIGMLEGHNQNVTAVAFTPDGRQALTGSSDKTTILWNLDGTPTQRFSMGGHTRSVTSVAINFDGKQAVTGSQDKTAILWELDSGRQIRTFEGHEGFVSAVAFSRDGSRVLTGSWDRSAILWNSTTGEQVRKYEDLDGIVKAVALSPDGQLVLVGTSRGTAYLYTVSGQESQTFVCPTDVIGVAFHPNRRQFFTASRTGGVMLWQIPSVRKKKD